MQKYLTYIREFHEGNSNGIFFINTLLPKHLKENAEDQTETETILDYLYSHRDLDISKMSYKLLNERKDKWHKKLQSVATKDNEVEGIDYETYLDFGDGFKFVKLLSQECYEREGKLMSHCVASYYGRDTTIYSLRDEKNNPHATVEADQQIKGKGNGKIDPKYIDYVVKFLEKNGMTVGENEMKNLGYYKIENIDTGLTSPNSYNGYIYEGKLDTLKDSDGDTYQGFGLLRVKKLVEVGADFSLKFNFDFDAMLSFFSNKACKITEATDASYSTAVARGYYSTAVADESSSTAVANAGASTAVANAVSSTAVANSHSSTAVANSYSSTAVARGYSSTAVANSYSSTAVANASYSTAVANANYSTAVARGYYSTAVANSEYSTVVVNAHSSTAVTNAGSSTVVANADYSTAVANSHSSTAVANSEYSTAVANSEYSTAVANGGKDCVAFVRGYKSKAKGKIGSWLVLSEYDSDNETIIDIQARKIDGVTLKEDTLYALEGGVFVEKV